MTAIIAVLDEKGVHIGTDSRMGADWKKADDCNKCRTLSGKIIYACAGSADVMDIVERFFSNRTIDMSDDTLFELREYILKFTEGEFGVIISDGKILKELDKDRLRYIDEYIWSGTGGMQALSVYLFTKSIAFGDTEEDFIKYGINTAIQMDIGCGGEAKYYFLKKPDGK